MGSNAKDNSTRRARIAEMRKAEQARERRSKIITMTVIAVIVLALIGGGAYLWSAGESKEAAKASPIKGEKTWKDLSRNHVQTKVDYPMSPPAGGDHNPVWAVCDGKVYTKEIPNEKAVHSLEHGAVWITYTDKAAKKDIEQLSKKVSSTPYTLMSPYSDQSSPITLTAWEHQIGVKKASDPRVEKFLSKYVQGPQTPEPGASCSSGSM